MTIGITYKTSSNGVCCREVMFPGKYRKKVYNCNRLQNEKGSESAVESLKSKRRMTGSRLTTKSLAPKR